MDSNFLASVFPLLIMVAFGFLLMIVWIIWVTARRKNRQENKDTPQDKPQSGGFLDKLLGDDKSQSEEGGGFLSGLLGDDPPQEHQQASVSPATAYSPPAAQAQVNDDAVEVFRVMRDLADGGLVVEINGMRYRYLSEITDAQVGRRFITNARELARFAMLIKGEAPPARAPAPPAQMPPAPLHQPVMPPASPQPSRPAPAQPSGGLSDMPPLTMRDRLRQADTGKAEPPKMRPLDILRGGDDDEEDKVPITGLVNLADEIETILQHRLSQTGRFAGRSIHVRPGDLGGVLIVIDNNVYDGVGEVPDPEIKQFIQEAIREWESRT